MSEEIINEIQKRIEAIECGLKEQKLDVIQKCVALDNINTQLEGYKNDYHMSELSKMTIENNKVLVKDYDKQIEKIKKTLICYNIIKNKIKQPEFFLDYNKEFEHFITGKCYFSNQIEEN